ncbi:MAG: hypothetical protein KZQ74_05255 [gamma proteobacterium symbiont of Bathyaustriella thionipta]|nr:hypothetical protein [gamma proteobacterium symbiont of Bathyaustriella thionipta]MCU7957766.1 hypothetical protein [gamma proteobacterium symbiont of Bathyaustriella thionipta]MCU7966594.1 hypothetical protein [gamma proteobacterium symbiont of Bathyaustriella thionipta]
MKNIGISGLTFSHDVAANLMHGNMTIDALSSETPSHWDVEKHIVNDTRKGEEDQIDVDDVLKRLNKI